MAHHPSRPPRHADHRIRPWSLALAAATVVLIGTVGTLVAHADGGPDSSGPSTASGSVARLDGATLQHAEALYLDDCASCHGRQGQGAGMPGMELPALDATGTAWQKTDPELETIVKSGAGLMPGVGTTWSKDDILAVLAMIRSWWTPEQLSRHADLATKSP